MKTTRSAKAEASMARAKVAYDAEELKARSAMNELRSILAEQATDGTEKDWGHVGSMEHIASLLGAAADHMAGRDGDEG